MQLSVTLRRDDDQRTSLAPGAIIGRMPHSALRIDDPRISEAHALVSLRGAQLKLLALRGRISVDGKPKTDVTLIPGVRMTLAGFYGLTVEHVSLPDEVLAIRLDAPPHHLIGAHGVVAIFPFDDVPLRAGYDPDAAAHVWTRGGESLLRPKVTEPDTPIDHRLAPDSSFVVEGRTFRLERARRTALEARATSDSGRFDTHLKLQLCFDAVRIHASDGRAVTIDGIAARLICELYEIAVPIAWQEVARLLWPTEAATPSVRQRWDQLLTRLRARLREAGVRSDLVRSTQRGLVELVLGPEDVVEDMT